MPRHPKPENANNPLRCLRVTLGTTGVPLPQHELASRLGISVETIKSLEGGRRRQGRPNREIIDSAFTHLGAQWSEEGQRWNFLYTGEPYTRADYERYINATFDRPVEIHALCLGLISLLQRVPVKDFPVMSDTISQSFLTIAQKYNINMRGGYHGGLVLNPIWKNGKETDNLADIVGYERSRDTWMWEKKDGKWRKRNKRSKLFDFRDQLQKDESPKT